MNVMMLKIRQVHEIDKRPESKTKKLAVEPAKLTRTVMEMLTDRRDHYQTERVIVTLRGRRRMKCLVAL